MHATTRGRKLMPHHLHYVVPDSATNWISQCRCSIRRYQIVRLYVQVLVHMLLAIAFIKVGLLFLSYAILYGLLLSGCSCWYYFPERGICSFLRVTAFVFFCEFVRRGIRRTSIPRRIVSFLCVTSWFVFFCVHDFEVIFTTLL